MGQSTLIYHNGPIFDGSRLHHHAFAQFEDGVLARIGRWDELPAQGRSIDLRGDILSIGYVDLQVNGGAGLMFGDDVSVEALGRMAAAHRKLGVTHVLPTLITDTPRATRAAIDVAIAAIAANVPGVAGLHLEGPHLSLARKGAHDAQLIRPMGADDLRNLIMAAADLPCLMVTVAPENVTEAQVAALARAGVIVSLGHSDAGYDTCQRYFRAGARCATHLFNAMSQLNSREPGLVGAALSCGGVHAGLIADAVHVHPATIRLAWQANSEPGRLFLVSDAMAVAGTDLDRFALGGRCINRRDGQLRLDDGTLAGADLDLTTAVSVLVNKIGVPLQDALRAATTVPARFCGFEDVAMAPGTTRLDQLNRISANLTAVAPQNMI
ncbi:N-acetylglucosamine-6-phosphate deacetylase [Paracoccus sp. Z330]|uniref:N-acetylglucosamine-6-phosphate deacetylase n=1 Tax=Paracoccus onchidii TaxID=3017813 RepID=A0ABT4ZDL4_9RHOB|nr:N-acetylglucosamine-6-phosphate deacetylase [Paracoccus onchidii]MDB6177364.1 N-acetylglucosamine-6-phosphate deacetylase [Paracoccus onchidii]